MTAGLACTTIYNQPYSHRTRIADVKRYAVGASPYAYAILGARFGSSSSQPFTLAAVGDYNAVFRATASTSTAYANSGAYWYFYFPRSMGFAPSSTITLNTADVYDSHGGSSGAYRLSWHLDQSSGGWRVGANTGLNGDRQWYKVVMYCN